MLIDEAELATRYLPELAETLTGTGMLELEEAGPERLVSLFRERGGPGFLIPEERGGMGRSLLDLAQLLRWVGARCPSLAVMMTMHHHAVGAFARGAFAIDFGDRLLQRVARDGALVATAFAEGRPGVDILSSTVRCEPREDGSYRISGIKRPCCMSHGADFAIVGVAVEDGDGPAGRGIALVERGADGLHAEESWPGEILTATDSHSLVFDRVRVEADHILESHGSSAEATMAGLELAHAEMALSCLFQLMVSVTYLGMTTALCERVIERSAGTPGRRLQALSRAEGAAMAVYRLAELLDAGDFSGYHLTRSMMIGHHAIVQIEEAVTHAVRALGGSGFLTSPEVQYLVLATRCASFHPPSEPLREEIVDRFYGNL